MSLLYEKIVQEDLNVGTSAAVTVTNPGGGSITGTQIGIHSLAVGQAAMTQDFDPTAIPAGSYTTENVSVPGAAVGDFVLVSFAGILSQDLMIFGHATTEEGMAKALIRVTLTLFRKSRTARVGKNPP